MPRFATSGHDLYYELHGAPSAPALVLLHEGLGAVREWRDQIAFFAPHYRVLAFDRWGYGQADARARFEPGYLDRDADEAIALLDALGVRGADVLGHSDGGSIALLIASRRPDLVRRLALEAAHIYQEPTMHAGILKLQSKLHASRRVRHFLEDMHGERGLAVAESWLALWAQASAPGPLVADEALRRIRAPALVIQGEEDEYATEQHARDIHAALPGSELWLIPGVGHVPHAELGDAFNDRVLRFFRSDR